MSEDFKQAIQTVDEMLRTRKDKMQINDCLAIGIVLKELRKQSNEIERLKMQNKILLEATKAVIKYSNMSVSYETMLKMAKKAIKTAEVKE